MFILVSYDISDNKSRDKVAKGLIRSGYSRVQRSLYISRFHGYRGLARRAAELSVRWINPQTDSVIILSIPDWTVKKAIIVGTPLGGLTGNVMV